MEASSFDTEQQEAAQPYGTEPESLPDEEPQEVWQPTAGVVGFDGQEPVYVVAVNDDGSCDVARFASFERGATMTLASELTTSPEA